MSTRPADHVPRGFPICACGIPSARHRVEHIPDGNPCIQCGLSENQHRVREDRGERVSHTSVGNPCALCGLGKRFHIEDEKKRRKNRAISLARQAHPWRPAETHQNMPEGACGRCGLYKAAHTGNVIYLGIDGEGQGRDPHHYVFLACSNEDGTRRWSVDAAIGIKDKDIDDTSNGEGKRLSTVDCLDFILSLPQGRHKVFAYAFQYDLTKILSDLDNKSIYKLFHPEERQRPAEQARKGPFPVLWQGYTLNLQASKFTVSRGQKRVVIWDIFKFFQGKFVSAIRDWKVGNERLWNDMTKMKDQRGEFDKLDKAKVQEYCFTECGCMAGLARRLTEAHISAGLVLKNYYGAGSSAAAMLSVMGIKDKIRPVPDELVDIASKAFFGGRFENSIVGTVEGTVWGYDISSAYPYELCFLPCLMHGQWEHSLNRQKLDESNIRQALVRYRLNKDKNDLAWGPFPFREMGGSIVFPSQSGGGWIYRDEYLTGERLFSNVEFLESWNYKCECDCQPFSKIPEYYLVRIRIGKEGPGIVIKLGCNSCYGKLAQSVGNAPFNSWLWAGMITSGTRGKLLSMLGLMTDRSNLYMMATDGIVSRERLVTPIPRDTGTWDAFDKGDQVNKPLGGWEEKEIKKGMFFARPGIYFPIRPTEKELKSVRGRGVGRKAILDNWGNIVDTYNTLDKAKLTDTIVPISEVSRFCGAKGTLSKMVRNGEVFYNRAKNYGEWIVRPIEMSFNPLPKRAGLGDKIGTAHQLQTRKLLMNLESSPYNRATSEESVELRFATDETMEQPDGDLTEYL